MQRDIIFYNIKKVILNMLMRIMSIFPVNDTIVFVSYFGRSYSDNPRIIYETMYMKHANKFHYVWLMNDTTQIIEGAKVVKYRSLSAIYYMVRAVAWVDNCRKPVWIHKRKEQFYLQSWHGTLPLKKIEKDAENKLSSIYILSAINDSKMADLFISGCREMTRIYREAFWYTGKVLECGIPRSDIFYKPNTTVLNTKVRDWFGLSENVNIAIYAPTFRDSRTVDCYDLDCMALKSCLEDKFHGKWKILVRMHPNVLKCQSMLQYNKDIINASNYLDMNELIVACDFLITDYSSCMFDAMECRKPVVLYATDINEYVDERGFYFSFKELPFEVATDNELLIQKINEFDYESYQEKITAFSRKIGLCNNANSAKNIAEYIVKYIQR